MFKKIFAILLTLLMVVGTFCMLGCGRGDSDSVTNDLTPEQQIEQSEFLYPDKTEDFRYNKYTHYIKITQCLSLKSNIVIPDTIAGLPVYEIAENAFENQLTITSVSITDNVFIIGINAFAGCTNLQEIKLPKGLTTLGSGAFARSGLKHIEFPNTLLTIPQNVCADCKNLSYIIIDEPDITGTDPDTGEAITTGERTMEQGAISNCESLKYFWIPEDVTLTDEKIGQADENIVIYGYTKSSAAVVAAASFVDFHLVQSKAELAEFKNKAELASDIITLNGTDNYKGSLISLQIEKTYIVKEKVTYTTSYEGDNHETITNTFEYEPNTNCDLVILGVKVTNNSAQNITFNELNSTIKVDTYFNRFINLGNIKNSALAKYSKPNYTTILPDETTYIYFAVEASKEWEEMSINFGNFSELINYNFVVKNDENVVYVGTESIPVSDEATINPDTKETGDTKLSGIITEIKDNTYTFKTSDDTLYKFEGYTSMPEFKVNEEIEVTCVSASFNKDEKPIQIGTVVCVYKTSVNVENVNATE